MKALSITIMVSENGLSERASVCIDAKDLDPDSFSVAVLIDDLVYKLSHDVEKRVEAMETPQPAWAYIPQCS